MDNNYTIISHFENSYNDTLGHDVSYNGTEFTSESLVGNFSIVINNDSDYVRWENPSISSYEGTIECWYSPTSFVHDSQILSCVAIDNWDRIAVRINPVGDIYGNYNNGTNWVNALYANQSLTLGVPSHIAFTWGPAGTAIWINQTKVGQTDIVSFVQNPHYYGIGDSNGNNRDSALGKYDNFKLSNIQRTNFTTFDDLKPAAPILNPIISPSKNGNISLSWNSVELVKEYRIYRYNQYISEINNSIELVYQTNSTSFKDINLTNGKYYYVISAYNYFGTSPLSNCEFVIVNIDLSQDNNLYLIFFYSGIGIVSIITPSFLLIRGISSRMQKKNIMKFIETNSFNADINDLIKYDSVVSLAEVNSILNDIEKKKPLEIDIEDISDTDFISFI